MNITTAQTQQAEETIKSLTDGCCLVGFKVNSSCGEATLSNATTELNGNKITSQHVKGTKIQWFPKGELTLTGKYNAKLTRIFAEFGVRWGDLYIIPKQRLDEFRTRLEESTKDWEDDKANLMASYDDILLQHKSQNPEIADLIDSFKLDVNTFASRFKMAIRPPLAIQPLFPEDGEEMLKTISASIWDEIESDANSIYRNSWFKKQGNVKVATTYVTQAIRHPLERLRKKLVSLSDLEPKLENVCRGISELFNALPMSGKIVGHDFEQLTNWMHILGSREKLRLHANGEQVFKYEPVQPKSTPKTVTQTTESSATTVPHQPINATPIPAQSSMDMDFGMTNGW